MSLIIYRIAWSRCRGMNVPILYLLCPCDAEIVSRWSRSDLRRRRTWTCYRCKQKWGLPSQEEVTDLFYPEEVEALYPRDIDNEREKSYLRHTQGFEVR